MSVNFVQISLDGQKLEKVTKIPLANADENALSETPYINDQRKYLNLIISGVNSHADGMAVARPNGFKIEFVKNSISGSAA